jgi:hypothetical protein
MICPYLKSHRMLRNGIARVCFYFYILFRAMVRQGIPRVCSYFFYTERNSEHFSHPRNGSELNSEGLLLFLSHCTEFQAFFSAGSEWNSQSFLFRGTAGIPPEQSNFSVLSVFHGIIFFVGNC